MTRKSRREIERELDGLGEEADPGRPLTEAEREALEREEWAETRMGRILWRASRRAAEEDAAR